MIAAAFVWWKISFCTAGLTHLIIFVSFSFLFYEADAGILLHRFDIENNLMFINCTQKRSFHRPDALVINYDFELTENILKMVAYINLRIPENRLDKEYKKDLLRTTVDLQKFIAGAHSNILIRSLIKTVTDSMNVEPKFPVIEVSGEVMNYGQIFCKTFFQRIVRFQNSTFADPIFMPRTKYLLTFRFVGKVPSTTKMVFLTFFTFYGELT